MSRSRTRPQRPEAGPIEMVAVVVVTHAGAGVGLDRCIESVLAGAGHDLVVLVDNSGRPATPRAGIVVCSTPNRGFGAAANHGARLAGDTLGGPCAVVVLNDDVVVDPQWLLPLREALDQDRAVGVAQPKLLLAASPPTVNSVGVHLDEHGAGHDIGYGEPDDDRFAATRPIEIFTGGAVMFRAEFWRDTGGFDERYFLYYEDVDLSLRGRELGWRSVCVPASVVVHDKGSTTSTIGDDLVELQEINRLRAAFRHAGVGVCVRAVWLSIRRLRRPPRTIHAVALIRGLGTAPSGVLERARRR